MDALTCILRSVRLKTSILMRAELSSPWAISTIGIPGAAILHAVLSGGVSLRVGDETITLGRGDAVVLPHGGAHVLSDVPGRSPVPISSLSHTDRDGVPVLVYGGGKEPVTRILCGKFQLDHAAADGFFSLLPRVLRVPTAATLSLIDGELGDGREGSDAIVTRLCDVLLMQLLRAASADAPKGWLAALHDPQIGKALAMIHDDPTTRWDAAVLAERVGMSRSRFFARFSELVGEPPAQYLSRWRVQVAADELRKSDLSTSELAQRSGYASEDAFARVFKRHLGMSPREYRRAVRAEGMPSA